MSDHNLAVRALSGLEQIRGKLSEFWQWWTGELIGLTPASIRHTFEIPSRMLLIRLSDNHCTLTTSTAQGENILTEFSLDSPTSAEEAGKRRSLSGFAEHTVLLLPTDQILYKTITLPAATASRLKNVLAFEMDRNTPFKADDVYFTFRITSRDIKQHKIQVELTIVTRKILDELTQKIAALGVDISRVVPGNLKESEIGNPERNLLPQPDTADKRSGAQTRRLLSVWGLVIVILFIAFIALYQRYQRAEQLSGDIEAPRAEAMQAKSIRDELATLKASRAFLLNSKISAPSMLVLLKTLTEIIPDNTWLVRLTINEGLVTLQGESSDASALISLIEDAPAFRNVQFSSPVTINPRTQKERFSITASLAQNEPQPQEVQP